MRSTATKLVGLLVWKGGRWYLRQRFPRARALAVRGVLAGGAVAALALLARRARG